MYEGPARGPLFVYGVTGPLNASRLEYVTRPSGAVYQVRSFRSALHLAASLICLLGIFRSNRNSWRRGQARRQIESAVGAPLFLSNACGPKSMRVLLAQKGARAFARPPFASPFASSYFAPSFPHMKAFAACSGASSSGVSVSGFSPVRFAWRSSARSSSQSAICGFFASSGPCRYVPSTFL